jgi:hypothetical protein
MNTRTITAGAALTRGQLVVAAATATTAKTDSAYGVVQDGAASGNPASVCVFGKTRVLAASAISVGDSLMPASGGKVQTFDAADGSTLAGWALEAASADGDLIEVIFLGAADFSDSVTAASVTAANTAGALREFSTITVSAEDSDVITITLAQNVAAADQWLVRCLTAAETLATTASEYAITETGGGTLSLSHATLEAHLLTLSAAGAAVLTVTDVGGGSDATVYVELRPVEAAQGGIAGCSYLIPVTFDAT